MLVLHSKWKGILSIPVALFHCLIFSQVLRLLVVKGITALIGKLLEITAVAISREVLIL